MASFLSVLRVVLLSVVVSSAAAQCTNPVVRREWRALSDSERGEWIRAVNCLSTVPHDTHLTPLVSSSVSLIPPVTNASNFYDDLVYMHMDLNTKIHFTGLFLPWHRHYVHYFEQSLIQKCHFTGVMPYWDWTLDAANFQNSAFFDPSALGVGTWGDPNNGFQIFDGGFKDLVRAYPSPHHIMRNFSLYPFTNPNVPPPWGNATDAPPPDLTFQANTTFTPASASSVVNGFVGNYSAMQAAVDVTPGYHAGIHEIIGGDMTGICPPGTGPPACYPGPKWTPNDPLFFLHHAMVDRLWSQWQLANTANTNLVGGGSIQATDSYTDFVANPAGLPPTVTSDSELYGDGLWSGIHISDVISTTAGELCYTYA